MFNLHPALAKKEFICDLSLCRVLFEDNRHYPWIFLVPRRKNIRRMGHLVLTDRFQLTRELTLCEKVMEDLFQPDQINVAAIGNKTPQLHIHIICRKISDPDWPETVWGKISEPYGNEEKRVVIETIRSRLQQAALQRS